MQYDDSSGLPGARTSMVPTFVDGVASDGKQHAIEKGGACKDTLGDALEMRGSSHLMSLSLRPIALMVPTTSYESIARALTLPA